MSDPIDDYAGPIAPDKSRDHLPVQDDRYPFGGMNPGLEPIRPAPALRLIARWRAYVNEIGPRLEGAAFEQCANDLEALLYEETDAQIEPGRSPHPTEAP